MTTKSDRMITIRLDPQKVKQTLIVLPSLIALTIAIIFTINDIVSNTSPQLAETASTQPILSENITGNAAPQNSIESALTYPVRGSDLNTRLFSVQLPPPPLDAMPYDVNYQLFNGLSVPTKKRWIWIPDNQQIVVENGADGTPTITIPDGAIWWKEFYVETDKGSFLIERRVIMKVPVSKSAPQGWALYSAYHIPEGESYTAEALILDSASAEAARYSFLPHEWMPTQPDDRSREVRFEDSRGVQHAYLFPGQIQCMACHGGSAGAYPEGDANPIFVFGLHPNNLTPESFMGLIQRGWLTNGDLLLDSQYQQATEKTTEGASLDDLTQQFVGVLRNNCASCHTDSSYAAAGFTAFTLDPNHAYTADELIQLFSTNGMMLPDAKPLVVPGSLEQSELWLRLNGLDGRRRMPPVEGGLPDIDPRMVDLLEAWIIKAGEL